MEVLIWITLKQGIYLIEFVIVSSRNVSKESGSPQVEGKIKAGCTTIMTQPIDHKIDQILLLWRLP